MQINKPKLLGITLIHVLLLAVVLGITTAIAHPAKKESLTGVDKISETGLFITGGVDLNPDYDSNLHTIPRLIDMWDTAGDSKSGLSTF